MSGNPPSNYLEEVLKALSMHGGLNPPAPMSIALNGLFGMQPQQPPSTLASLAFTTQKQGLGGVFGLTGQLPPIPATPAPIASLSVTPTTERRVFYSFHYDDVNRVNVVRNSGKIRSIDRERRKSVFDKSLWERSKSTSDEVLKSSINRGLAGTSATCVLVGQHTWQRPWVRYEIAQSLFMRNGIFAVRIDSLWCIGSKCYGMPGPNPLDYMALGRDDRGRIQVYEHDGHGWIVFGKMQKFILAWPKWLAPVDKGHCRPLGEAVPIYNYETERGSDRLLIWANAAAKMAGK